MIPFIRKIPNNKAYIQDIARSPVIEKMALEFLCAGGWYTAEILPSGKVRLQATDDELNPICGVDTNNGETLMGVIDQLVEMSVQEKDKLKSPPPKH